MAEQLMPCPHCGARAHFTKVRLMGLTLHGVSCEDEDDCGAETRAGCASEGAAADLWNRRYPGKPDDSQELWLGKAVIDGLHQHPSWPAWTDLEILDAYLGSGQFEWPVNAFFLAIRKAIADNHPGKPEREEGVP